MAMGIPPIRSTRISFRATTVVVAETGVQTEDLCDDEDTDGYQAESTNLGKDLLQVAGRIVVLANE